MSERESIWLKGFSKHYNPDEINLTLWHPRLKGSQIIRTNATVSFIMWWSVTRTQMCVRRDMQDAAVTRVVEIELA
jgi:hypothetical protein